MLRMAQDFVREHPHGVDLSRDAFERLFVTALDHYPLAMWIAEGGGEPRGMMGALCYPLFFNPGMGIAQELFVWIDEAHRGSAAFSSLLSTFEAWALKNNANRLMITAPHSERIDAMQRLYQRAGYTPLERTFYKDISPCQ